MIEINNDAAPDYLTSDAVEASKVRIREQANNGDQNLNIPNHWSDKRVGNTIKDVLYRMHNGKCCYCERKRTRTREMDVEHYRPKAGVTDVPDHSGYWWLAYDWNNYLWSCKSCNEDYKTNHFSLLPTGIRAVAEGGNLELELPDLINPRFDRPSDYFAYHKKKLGGRWFVKLIPLPDIDGDEKQRADLTIRILGLNRVKLGDDLVSERGDSLSPDFENIAYSLKIAESAVERAADPDSVEFYEQKIRVYRNKLRDYIRSDKEFSGFFRFILTDLGIDFADLI